MIFLSYWFGSNVRLTSVRFVETAELIQQVNIRPGITPAWFFLSVCLLSIVIRGLFLCSSVRAGSKHAWSLRMGGSGSKARGVWPFSGGGAAGDPSSDGTEQSIARLRGSRSATPFVFTRRRWVTLGGHLHSSCMSPGSGALVTFKWLVHLHTQEFYLELLFCLLPRWFHFKSTKKKSGQRAPQHTHTHSCHAGSKLLAGSKQHFQKAAQTDGKCVPACSLSSSNTGHLPSANV